MDRHADHPHRPTGRRRRAAGAAIATTAVAALLLGACSSASNDAASTGSGSGRETTAGGGGAVANGGWSDCPEPCTFDPDEEAARDDAYARAETEVLLGEGPASTLAPAAPGAAPLPATGPVTAGSVDDNEDWDAYLRYRQEFDASGQVADPIVVEGRQVIRVVDAAGRPVLGASVVVRDSGGTEVATLRTYADGRALFHPSTAVDPNSQNRPRYTATVTKGDQSEELALSAETRSYEVALDGDVAASGPVALDVVFLIDTTGSMGDEIDRLKANINSMAEQISALPVAPDVRYGMTLYRDEGDLFVTRTFDLTGDQAAFSEALDAVQADGGGDTPEDLDTGLRDAVDKQSWRGDDAVKLVFVVADAPPHVGDDPSSSYATTVVDAAARGIKVLPIGASGLDPQGEYVMRQLAQVTLGRFVFLTYGVDGASPGDSTPMNVDRDQYSVLPLDELVVQLVADELAPLVR